LAIARTNTIINPNTAKTQLILESEYPIRIHNTMKFQNADYFLITIKDLGILGYVEQDKVNLMGMSQWDVWQTLKKVGQFESKKLTEGVKRFMNEKYNQQNGFFAINDKPLVLSTFTIPAKSQFLVYKKDSNSTWIKYKERLGEIKLENGFGQFKNLENFYAMSYLEWLGND